MQTGTLRQHYRFRPIFRHPDWQLHQRAVRLADDQSDLVTMAIASGNSNRFPVTGMKSVTDNRLARLIAGIMKLLHRRPEPSQAAAWFTSKTSYPPVQLVLFRAGLFMDCQKRLDHGSKLIPVDNQLHLSPKLRTDLNG
ncbi:hypothetical protein NKH85_33275 [Mesorhizobium sp. M0924]|uniref:hypothetical protein n=1 Tax=unclassified Mesorhizobium TaxID=325217 RepID=UPI003338EEDE